MDKFGIYRSGNECRLRFWDQKHEWIPFWTVICDQSSPPKIPQKIVRWIDEKKLIFSKGQKFANCRIDVVLIVNCLPYIGIWCIFLYFTGLFSGTVADQIWIQAFLKTTELGLYTFSSIAILWGANNEDAMMDPVTFAVIC